MKRKRDRSEEAKNLLVEFQKMWSDPPLDVQQFEMLKYMISTALMSRRAMEEASDPDKGSISEEWAKTLDPKPKKGARIDPEWKLTPDMGNYGRSRGLHRREVEQEAEKFRNYWSAKPGAAGVKLDWPATWRNWCISAAERLGRVPPQDPNTPSPAIELDRQTWENLAKIYEAQSNWRLDWGPEPGSPGCRMPADLQAKFVGAMH